MSSRSSGAWFPLKTFDCSASFTFLWLTFSESRVPLQFCSISLNHCHLSVSYEPRQPRSLSAVWLRNKSVSIVLMAALLNQNAKKPSLMLGEMPSDQAKPSFLKCQKWPSWFNQSLSKCVWVIQLLKKFVLCLVRKQPLSMQFNQAWVCLKREKLNSSDV